MFGTNARIVMVAPTATIMEPHWYAATCCFLRCICFNSTATAKRQQCYPQDFERSDINPWSLGNQQEERSRRRKTYDTPVFTPCLQRFPIQYQLLDKEIWLHLWQDSAWRTPCPRMPSPGFTSESHSRFNVHSVTFQACHMHNVQNLWRMDNSMATSKGSITINHHL